MTLIDAGYGSSYTFEKRYWRDVKSGFTKIQTGDIAYAKITPCFQNRKSFILGEVPGNTAAATTELNVLRIYDDSFAQRYLLYFLKSDYFIKEAKYKGTAGQQRVLADYVRSKLIPIPPREEQDRICNLLQEVLPVVDKYDKSQTALDQLNDQIHKILRKSILQEAIQGKLVPQIAEEGTAGELLAKIRKEKERLVKEGKLKKSALAASIIFKGDDNKYYEKIGKNLFDITNDIPFEIPPSWSWIRGKQAFLPMESIKPSSDFIYIDIDAVNNKLNIIDNPKILKVSQIPSRATRKLHSDDILFSMVRPYLRNIAIVEKKFKNAIASTGFYVISPTTAFYSKYIFNLLLSNYVIEGLTNHMKGDNSPSINNYHIENYLYPLPPISEQQRIVAQIEKLFEQLR